ncbi:MAG: iron ABC transporter permease [Bacteroidales bacterium]|nr:iron ABC transporter permease [Candidatus Colimorpha onthohippi]
MNPSVNHHFKHTVTWLVLIAAIVVAAVLSSLVGSAHLSWHELWSSTILWQLRMPRIVLSFVVGSVLAICGATYQSLFRNPLTDPYLLGVSSGASLGAAIAIVCGLELYLYGVGLCAFVAAIITVIIICGIAARRGRIHTTTLLLAGVSITLLSCAVVSFLMVMNNDKLDRIVFWTMGSFSTASWLDVLFVAPPAIVGSIVLCFFARQLNMLLLGSESAMSMGVNVERTKKILLVITTIMVAFAVSVSGVIGFVGLIVPHAVRLLIGTDNRRLLPASALIGGLFLLICDTLARTLFQPSELPVGSLTALIGAPIFIYLICRKS